MSFGGTIKKLSLLGLDLVFPISCLECGRDGVYLCGNCINKLPRLPNQFCIVCQNPAPFGKTHAECRTKNTVDGSISSLSYKDRQISKLIEVFKYNFVADLAPILSQLMLEAIRAQGLADYFSDFEIMPIPLHSRRLNWRGFNQAELLAQKLAKQLNIKLENNLVIRSKFTKPQVKLTAEERRKNIDNAFALTGDPSNKKILLVDDVVTSGSTANELAKLLKRAHAAEIWILSAAHG